MPIAEVLLTDTLDQFRQKTNLAIDTLNSLAASGTVLSISHPASGQILVYNGTVFANVTLSGDVSVAPNGVATINSEATGVSKGRMAFAGARSTVY